MATSNKETVRRVQEAWNQNRLDDLDQYFAPDFKANSNMERKVEIIDIIEEGDKVVLRNRATGKHTGESWRGAPSDGQAYDIESWSIYRFRDGKIVEHWGLNDGVRLIMQLGGQLPQRPAAAAASR